MLANVRDKLGGCASRQNTKQQKKNSNKTILFAPLDAHGHINSLICIADHLKSLGFKTVFLFIEPFESGLERRGHLVYDSTTADLAPSKPSAMAQDKWNEVIRLSRDFWKRGDALASLEDELRLGFGTMIADIKKYNANIEAKLELVKPACIVVDHYFGVPALFKYLATAGVPWIRVFSAAPLALFPSCSRLPPQWLGLPSRWNENDGQQVKAVVKARELYKQLYDNYKQYWQNECQLDGSLLPEQTHNCLPYSKHLNLYMYPDELDYCREFGPLDGDCWTQCETLIRRTDTPPFEVPPKFYIKNNKSKLIFLSLGSLASADVELMTRLTSMLDDSRHKFIVSKGPLGDSYKLPKNMLGSNFVDQLAVLQVVDLIITHGGNNTLTESFYYGVPGFIVCPLFSDQLDNAQRIVECNLGERLDPYNCTKDDLHSAIERVLNNDHAKDTMRKAGERIRKPQVRQRALDAVVKVLRQSEKKSKS